MIKERLMFRFAVFGIIVLANGIIAWMWGIENINTLGIFLTILGVLMLVPTVFIPLIKRL